MDSQSPKTKNQKPKTAVIGVGSLGQHHARNFAELANEGKGEFVGVCDSNEEHARTIAEKNSCEYFTDWRELLDKTDAVSIVTPTETHSEIACEFLEKGVNVLVEKPFARSLEEADKMIAAAQKTGAKLMVGHLERYNPAMVALRPHVTNPLYFEIHRVSPFPNRSLDVDVVLDVMIHDLDAINGSSAKISMCRKSAPSAFPLFPVKLTRQMPASNLKTARSPILPASRIGTEKIRKTRFYQTNSYVVLDYGTKFASVTSLNPEAAHPLLGISINRLEIEDIEPLRAELSAFFDCVINDTAPPINAHDGRRALALALGVLEKIETHRSRLNV